MPYILSKLSNTQIYTQYAKGANNLNQIVKSVVINGGADVTNKNFVVPDGVVTKISAEELEVLKANKDFQSHLEQGYVKYFGGTPNVEKEAPKMEKDKSRQLTPEDFTKAGKKAPKIEKD